MSSLEDFRAAVPRSNMSAADEASTPINFHAAGITSGKEAQAQHAQHTVDMLSTENKYPPLMPSGANGGNSSMTPVAGSSGGPKDDLAEFGLEPVGDQHGTQISDEVRPPGLVLTPDARQRQRQRWTVLFLTLQKGLKG